MILEDFLIRYGNIEVTEVYLGDVMLTDIYRAIFSLTSSIGFRHNINEAIKANKAAGVWGVASGWTPKQLALCMIFQDAAGTIPVFAPEQPCGLLLDGRYKPGTRGVNIYVEKPDGYFNFEQVDNGWSSGIGSKSMDFVSVKGGATYEITPIDGSWNRRRIQYELTGGGYLYDSVNSTESVSGVRFFLNVPQNALKVRIYYGTSGATVTSISVREVPGVHLTQATVGARPVVGARVNQLNNSAFVNSGGRAPYGWSANAGGTSGATGVATNGDIIFTQSGAAERAFLTVNTQFNIGESVELSVIVAAASGLPFNNFAACFATGAFSYFINGAVVLPTDAVVPGRLLIRFTPSVSSLGSVRLGLGASSNATGSVSFHSPDLRLVINATPSFPAYQRVTSPTDYDDVGFPYKLKFNGTNQWMQHAALNLTGTDEVTVWAGVTKLSDAALAVLYSFGDVISGPPGSFGIRAPVAASVGNYNFSAVGSSLSQSNYNRHPSPDGSAVIGVAKISTPRLLLFTNGVKRVDSPTTMGTGNYSNYPGYIGTRTGTSAFFNGELYELGLVGKLLKNSQIQSLNRRVMKGLGL